MPDFARNIISKPPQGPPRSRQRALIRLFALFRQTALPSFFPAIKATRPERPCCSVENTIKVRYGVCSRLPYENRWEISVLDVIVSNLTPCYTQRRLRPLARRAASTARPPFVDIRARKPWHFARLRVFGWYVRFISIPFHDL